MPYIRIAGLTSGLSNVYAVAFDADDPASVWDQAAGAMAAYANGDWADYAIPLAEIGTSGAYYGQFAGKPGFGFAYDVEVRRRTGGTPSPNPATDPFLGGGTVGYTQANVGFVGNAENSAAWLNQFLTDLAVDGLIAASLTGDVNGTVGGVASGGIDHLSFAPGAVDATALGADVGPVLANALLDLTNAVGSNTVRQLLRGFAATLLGKSSGATASGGTVVFRDLADTKNVVSATCDANGNRTAVTRNLT